jgi:hypothetical protein
VAEKAPDRFCSYADAPDFIDGFDMNLAPVTTGGFSCQIVEPIAVKLYNRGLDARDKAVHAYKVSRVTWTCTTSSYAANDGYYSGEYLFTCDAQPFPRDTLTQQITFGGNPPQVSVTCEGGNLCEENSPQINGDYGDVNNYATAGLQLVTNDGGTGAVPLPGAYNQWAWCVWQSPVTNPGNGLQTYTCGYPG